MKVKLNLDLDIELTADGKKVLFSELLQTAQTVAAHATERVVDEVAESTTKKHSTQTGPDNTQSGANEKVDASAASNPNACLNSSESPGRTATHVDPPTLHPLGSVVCELLHCVADLAQTPQNNTFDSLKDGVPK